MNDRKFEVGDVVQYNANGEGGYKPAHGFVGVIMGTFGVFYSVIWLTRNCKPWAWALDGREQVFHKNIEKIGHIDPTTITETSDVPPNQNPPPASTASPASDTQTSSARGCPTRPSNRRGSARSKK